MLVGRKQKTALLRRICIGGGEGNRTPVQGKNAPDYFISGVFPFPGGLSHPRRPPVIEQKGVAPPLYPPPSRGSDYSPHLHESKKPPYYGGYVLVEVRGIEPLSGGEPIRLSPSAVSSLNSPYHRLLTGCFRATSINLAQTLRELGSSHPAKFDTPAAPREQRPER